MSFLKEEPVDHLPIRLELDNIRWREGTDLLTWLPQFVGVRDDAYAFSYRRFKYLGDLLEYIVRNPDFPTFEETSP